MGAFVEELSAYCWEKAEIACTLDPDTRIKVVYLCNAYDGGRRRGSDRRTSESSIKSEQSITGGTSHAHEN